MATTTEPQAAEQPVSNDADCSEANQWINGPKPIEWGLSWNKHHKAVTLIGSYVVTKEGDTWWPEDETDDAHECQSVEEGKRKCEEDYRRRLASLFVGN